ncbi:MAG: hypothetical protein AB7D96_10675 [Arcobacteraceae bacterium]
MINITSLKTLFPISIEDEQIQAHLNRATKDYKDIEFEDEDQELEVVGSKTIYYLAPLLWVDMQNRVQEYAESLSSFKDIKSFQQIWLDRAETALSKVNTETQDNIGWDVI